MRLRAILLVIGLIGAACGGSGDSADGSSSAPPSTVASTTSSTPTTSTSTTTTTTTTTTTSTAPTTTATAAPAVTGEIAPTPVNAFMAAYGDFAPEDLPFPDGSVMVYWYQSQATGLWVAVFKGWDTDASGPQCPGASIHQAGTFSFISNGESGSGGCDDPQNRVKLADAPAGFRQCGALAYYVTEVPIAEEGLLFGTIERVVDGGFVGSTSQAQSAPTPDFIVDATSYSVPADFFSSGETMVSC